MMYLVIAKDGTDPEASARRQKVRAKHLELDRCATCMYSSSWS